MTEMISINVTPVSGTYGYGYHASVSYTDSTGRTSQIHGGGIIGTGATAIDEAVLNVLGFGSFGQLYTRTIEAPISSRSNVVGQIHGQDLSATFSAMRTTAHDITQADRQYNMLSTNSNSVVATMLDKAGIPTPAAMVNYNVPGYRVLETPKYRPYSEEQKKQLDALPNDFCFLAGTLVSMWPLDVKPDANGKYDQKEVQTKVWTKPIEEVTPEDLVVSYDDDGLLIPGRVTQTFENGSKHILDVPVPQFDEQGKPDGTFRSLLVTPGHVTYCAKVEGEDNPFAGKHAPIMDILRSDGALKMQDGTIIRAATGAIVGSQDDQQFWAFKLAEDADGKERVVAKRQLRFGSRWMLPDGRHLSMRDYLDGIGGEIIREGPHKGYARFEKSGLISPFAWTLSEALPNPEDYILQRSALTLEEVYEADEWENVRPQMPAPVAGEAGLSLKQDNTLYAGGAAANDHLSPNIPHSMRKSPNQPAVNRQQRRALECKQQKANRGKTRSAAKINKQVAATVH